MFVHKTPRVVQKLYPSLTWSKRTKKNIYLTFDDGPIPVITPFVLQTLSDFGVKATFFCVGDNLRKHKDIAIDCLERGHKVANHTYHHLNGWKTSNEMYLENIEACEELISDLGVRNNLFRPPYGRISRKQISRVGQSYEITMWNVLTGDYSSKVTPAGCLKRSIDVTEAGSIVLFHDNVKAEKNLRHTLPRYIEHFLNQGFSFDLL